MKPTRVSHSNWLLGVLLVGPFMAQADATIANVAAPSIHADLGASGAVQELVIGGYLIAFAVLLITGARLGQTHGYRRVFLLGVGLFTVASLLCGLAPDAIALVVARVLQGFGAALTIVAADYASDISGVSTTTMQIGGALGVAALGTLYLGMNGQAGVGHPRTRSRSPQPPSPPSHCSPARPPTSQPDRDSPHRRPRAAPTTDPRTPYPRRIDRGHGGHLKRWSIVAVSVEPQAPRDHVPGDIAQPPVMRVRVGT
jgi:hypothetical protein